MFFRLESQVFGPVDDFRWGWY